MKNSLKLLLLSLVGITALTSTTHALEIISTSRSYVVSPEIKSYHLKKSTNIGDFRPLCLTLENDRSISSTHGIKLDAPICDDGSTLFIYEQYSSNIPKFGSLGTHDYYAPLYFWNKDLRKIYRVVKFEAEGGGYKYLRLNMDEGSLYKIQSKRGSNVYVRASLYGPGLVFVTKKNDQLKFATYVSHAYVLDGFAVFADTLKLLLIDTYKNKVYDYGSIWQDIDRSSDNRTLFNKLYNLAPEKVYDIQRGVGTNQFKYTKNNEYLNFDLTNEQPATDETHTTIQQDLKDSLTWLNEYSHLWLGTTPEELGITNGQPNTPNQDNNSGNSTPSFEQSLAEYNQCVGYRQNVKTYATYDRGCYRGLLDSAPLTGSYDTQTLLSDRKKIKERNGSGELELGDEVACLRFAERKKLYKEKYSTKWEEFQKHTDDFWLNPERLVINDVCGTFLKIPPKNEEENIDDLLKNNQFIGGVGDYIAGMFRGYGEGSGYNYLEKMEYYRERTVCTLFGWVNQEFCSKLEDPNTKNRYIKKDQDDKIDNSSGFGFFLRKIKTEFDKGKSFLQVNKCTNIGFGKERDMLLYIPMVYLILYLLRFLNNGK